MILLCGIPSESPMAMVCARLDELGMPYLLLNQRDVAHARIAYEVSNGEVSGELWVHQQSYPLSEFSGIYTRLMDDQSLPEVRHEPTHSPIRVRCRAFHDALIQWMEITPARVVNRIVPMASNSSKPYQAQLIRQHGFLTPETLITNDPEVVRAFHAQHGRVIYKSISSVRSIVQTLEVMDYSRLESIRWCPTQFQAFVAGDNVRVHVVDRQVFATRIRTDVTDYRYAHHQGSEAELTEVTLDSELAERCVELAQALELPFAGIDLKITPDDEVYCFEVNPSPGFSYYESHTGQPISNALAQYLAGLTEAVERV
jgi:glutathione synthase/RimK-type ligase-like ATP-grasp enzyme